MKKPIMLGLLLTMAACTHTEAGNQKSEFEVVSEKRIEAMECQVEKLSKRRDQLLGQPKADLAAAIEALKIQVTKANDELKELKKTDEAKWLEKKAVLDRELYNMDSAHGTALKVFLQ